MNRIVRDYFCVSIAKIINERLFSIVNRIYDVHKHYVFEIIKTKMICRQHDQKKHEKKQKQTNEFALHVALIAYKNFVDDEIMQNDHVYAQTKIIYKNETFMKTKYINDKNEINFKFEINHVVKSSFNCDTQLTMCKKIKKK